MEEPNSSNLFLADHIDLLINSYFRLTGNELIQPAHDINLTAKKVYNADFAVVSHDIQEDPVFNYGNKTALSLFEMDWESFTNLHSRKSAEPLIREERELLLQRVTNNGFIDDYCGIRISSSGKRFRITNATVWNLIDDEGIRRGQAATFCNWEFI